MGGVDNHITAAVPTAKILAGRFTLEGHIFCELAAGTLDTTASFGTRRWSAVSYRNVEPKSQGRQKSSQAGLLWRLNPN